MTDVIELAEFTSGVDVFGNIAKREIRLAFGQVHPPHEHNFAHAHIVVRGPLRLTLYFKDGTTASTDHPTGSMFEVPADVGHQLIALSPEGAIGYCLFAVRDEDGGVAYEVTDAHRKDRFWHERLGGGA